MKTATAIKLLILGLLLLTLGVAIKQVNYHTSPEQLRRALREELAASLEADLSLDSARLDSRAVLHAEGAAVTLAGQEEPFFTCREILIGFDKFEMLRLRPVVEKVVLVEPTLKLSYREEDRSWNFEAIRIKEVEKKAPSDELLREGIVIEDGVLVVQNAQLFGDDKPRTYPGFHLKCERDYSTANRWRFRGGFRGGALSGADVSGWFAAGQMPRFNLRMICRDLSADRAFWQEIPQGNDLWEEYQVEGRLSVEALISSRETGGVKYSLRIGVRDATARTEFFPTRICSINGLLEVTDGDLIIKDLSGVIPAEEFGLTEIEAPSARIRMDGVCHLDRPGGLFQISAVDLPICRTSIEGIPDIGRELWERLRPTGRSRITLTLTDPPGGGEMVFWSVVELEGVTLRPAELPFPLEQVSGTISVDNDGVRLEGLRGILVQQGPGTEGLSPSTAHFRADGLIDFEGKDGALNVTLRNVRTHEELVKAVPACGEQIWELLKPDVVLDASILLRDKADSNDMSYSVLLELRGGQVTAEAFPLPLKDLVGTIKADQGTISVEHITATLDTGDEMAEEAQATSSVEVRGVVDLEAERAELYMVARDLFLSEKLLAAIPGVGEEIWEAVRPRHTVSVSGKFLYDGQDEDRPLRYFLDLDIRDVSLFAQSLPVPVDALSGQLLVSESRMYSNDFTGVSCGGHFDGELVMYYGTEGELPSYGTRLNFSRIELADLVESLTGEETELAGRLSGVIVIGGILGDPSAVTGEGRILLTEGDVWQMPLFVGVLKVLHLAMPTGGSLGRGEATFELKGDEVQVHEFEVTGGGLNISGRGSVWLDGKLALTMVAIGAPEKGSGIPIVSSVVGWVLQTMERQLVRLDVSGTVGDPHFEHRVLSKITWPLTSLRGILLSPFFGSDREEAAED